MDGFYEFAKQDNVVAILAIVAIVLLMLLFLMMVRRGYGSTTSEHEDDGEEVKNPLILLLELHGVALQRMGDAQNVLGETQRTMGKTLQSVVALQEAQGKALAENTKLISDVRDDMKGRLQDHESAAEGRTAETLEVIREASAAMALIPKSLQSIQDEVGKNQTAIQAVGTQQKATDKVLKRIEDTVKGAVENADSASMLESVLGVVNDLKGMVEQALASRVAVPVGGPFTVGLESDEKEAPPSIPPNATTLEGGGKGNPSQPSPQAGRAVETVGEDEAAG